MMKTSKKQIKEKHKKMENRNKIFVRVYEIAQASLCMFVKT